MIHDKEQRDIFKKEAQRVFHQYFNEKNIRFIEYTDDQVEEYMRRWFDEFAPTECKEEARKQCFSDEKQNCYLWHLFCYGFVQCAEYEEAIQKYQNLEKSKCVILLDLEGLCFEVDDINAVDFAFINSIPDIYVTDIMFNWCYVHTHESECCGIGPYFYQK